MKSDNNGDAHYCNIKGIDCECDEYEDEDIIDIDKAIGRISKPLKNSYTPKDLKDTYKALKLQNRNKLNIYDQAEIFEDLTENNNKTLGELKRFIDDLIMRFGLDAKIQKVYKKIEDYESSNLYYIPTFVVSYSRLETDEEQTYRLNKIHQLKDKIEKDKQNRIQKAKDKKIKQLQKLKEEIYG